MLFKRFIEFILFILFITSAVFLFIFSNTPDPKSLSQCLETSMHKVKLCSQSNDYVALDKISSSLKNAILVSEDVGFYFHEGFDLYESYQSLKKNVKKGQFARGGSTITQQLVKNVFLSPEKSITRKLKEAYLAYQIEGLYSKDFIFEKYLNVIEFGPGVYGIKKAAWYYFNKKPDQLNVLESIYLAQLLPNPRKYSDTFVARTLDRRSKSIMTVLLKRLITYKRISQTEYLWAKSQFDQFPWINASPPSQSLAQENLEWDSDAIDSLESTDDPSESFSADDEEVEEESSNESESTSPSLINQYSF